MLFELKEINILKRKYKWKIISLFLFEEKGNTFKESWSVSNLVSFEIAAVCRICFKINRINLVKRITDISVLSKTKFVTV